MMRQRLSHPGHDLVTPDGYIQKIDFTSSGHANVLVKIEQIPPFFVGYGLPKELILFNFKSILAQLGINAIKKEQVFARESGTAEVELELIALSPMGKELLSLLEVGAYIGKLFAQDERRRVKNPDYLLRMFNRCDRDGKPLLSFGNYEKGDELLLEKVNGSVVAFLKLNPGRVEYDDSIWGFLPTLGAALKKQLSLRNLLRLHQVWKPHASRIATPNHVLLASTPPLHIRTAFAKVVDTLLPPGYQHTSANVLQPDTEASGDIYELFGNPSEEIEELPLEFFTLEPLKEYAFFSDKQEFHQMLQNPKDVFDAFAIAPGPESAHAATFLVKGQQMLRLKKEDWVVCDTEAPPFSEVQDPYERVKKVEEYIEKYATSYPFLKAMENGTLTSQGVLFCRHFPSPLIKRMLLSYYVLKILKGLYFKRPSSKGGDYFSQEDRAMMIDLNTFGVPLYWADETNREILQYVQRPGKTSGLFVPLGHVKTFRKATFFGVYGSNLIAGDFQHELTNLLAGILKMQNEVVHPLLNKDTPIALLTGGGPGAMEVGNKIAKELGLLSCAHIVDFKVVGKEDHIIHEQQPNPYVEAKMTYRLDQLIERQGEFYLDFPIFVMGGIGTDFEFSLEELRHKVGSRVYTPILLFGTRDYWRKKITSRFLCNLESGTIKGSEWVSNCFFCVQNAEQGLKVYGDFFSGKLKIGPDQPIFKDGFIDVSELIFKSHT